MCGATLLAMRVHPLQGPSSDPPQRAPSKQLLPQCRPKCPLGRNSAPLPDLLCNPCPAHCFPPLPDRPLMSTSPILSSKFNVGVPPHGPVQDAHLIKSSMIEHILPVATSNTNLSIVRLGVPTISLSRRSPYTIPFATIRLRTSGRPPRNVMTRTHFTFRVFPDESYTTPSTSHTRRHNLLFFGSRRRKGMGRFRKEPPRS